MKNRIVGENGSVQNIDEIPANIKALYKTVWELKQKNILEMAADRGAYICQSQSLNIHMQDANFGKLTSMHFYAWKKGLKTGMYYLRSTAAVDAIKFTLDKSAIQEPAVDAILVAETTAILTPATPVAIDNQQKIPYEQKMTEYEQKLADMTCSLDNPDACEACGS